MPLHVLQIIVEGDFIFFLPAVKYELQRGVFVYSRKMPRVSWTTDMMSLALKLKKKVGVTAFFCLVL